MSRRYKFFVVSGLLMLGSVSYAQQRSGPPPELFDACRNKTENQQCSAKTRQGQIQGMCRSVSRFPDLICAPDGGRPSGDRPSGGKPTNQANQNNTRPDNILSDSERYEVTSSSGEIDTIVATEETAVDSYANILVQADERLIFANGVPNHLVGEFPNQGNPNQIKAQNYQFSVPSEPQQADQTTPLGRRIFGVAINGVVFDPSANEWYQALRDSDWRYEALSGAVSLGIDENHAHVQPTGAYHYHGLPQGLLKELDFSKEEHSPLIGWAADGFPIYALYGYGEDGVSIVEATSSYRLKPGVRPSPPGDKYDGTFSADYEYLKGAGTLDACNGKVVKTPDFPNGSYAYFLTNNFPVIPRCFKGTPSSSFQK